MSDQCRAIALQSSQLNGVFRHDIESYHTGTINNSKQIYSYTVLLEKELDGGYHAFCPTLKGCHSQEDSFEEAVENRTEAIELYLESLRADNQ